MVFDPADFPTGGSSFLLSVQCLLKLVKKKLKIKFILQDKPRYMFITSLIKYMLCAKLIIIVHTKICDS